MSSPAAQTVAGGGEGGRGGGSKGGGEAVSTDSSVRVGSRKAVRLIMQPLSQASPHPCRSPALSLTNTYLLAVVTVWDMSNVLM